MGVADELIEHLPILPNRLVPHNPPMDLSHTAPWLGSMFALKSPLIEKILRPVIVYVALIVLLRIFGKRELAQLNPFDLVVLLSLSNTVQNAIIGDDNSVSGGVIGAFSLLAINYFAARVMFRNTKVEQLLSGSPTRLITNGQVDKEAMSRELMSNADLLSVIHRQGFDEVEEVDNCTLEPGGGFFIKGTKPDSDDRAHAELMNEFVKLQATVADLRHELRSRAT